MLAQRSFSSRQRFFGIAPASLLAALGPDHFFSLESLRHDWCSASTYLVFTLFLAPACARSAVVLGLSYLVHLFLCMRVLWCFFVSSLACQTWLNLTYRAHGLPLVLVCLCLFWFWFGFGFGFGFCSSPGEGRVLPEVFVRGTARHHHEPGALECYGRGGPSLERFVL